MVRCKRRLLLSLRVDVKADRGIVEEVEAVIVAMREPTQQPKQTLHRVQTDRGIASTAMETVLRVPWAHEIHLLAAAVTGDRHLSLGLLDLTSLINTSYWCRRLASTTLLCRFLVLTFS